MNHQFRDNKIITLGDTHNLNALLLIIKEKIPFKSDVFHVGDVGIGSSEQREIKMLNKINEVCVNNDIFLYLLRGNHDCPDFFWGHHVAFSNIVFVNDYDQLYFPNNKTALAVGGSISIDRCLRRVGETYWTNEASTIKEKLPKADFVFAHDCPNCAGLPTWSLSNKYSRLVDVDKALIEDCNAQRGVMDEILKKVKPKRWVFGHYHFSQTIQAEGCLFRCLDINELREFDANI